MTILDLAREAAGATGPEPWASEAGVRLGPNDRPSWCGLFVRAIWRRSGRDCPDWQIGSSNLGYLRETYDPQPGDLVMFRGSTGHQALLERLEGEYVLTWDGNTLGGIVAQRKRPRSEVLGYYEAPAAERDTEPPPSWGGRQNAAEESQVGGIIPESGGQLLPGLDVSDIQDPSRMDYPNARALGYRWLVAKLSDGKDTDVRGHIHLRSARIAGLVPGGFHFFIPWRDPRTQIAAFERGADAAGYGRPGDLLPWLDIESWRGASGQHNAEPGWNEQAEQLAEKIANRFGGVAIYLNHHDWTLLGRPTWIERYPLIAPHYGVPAGRPTTAAGLDWAVHQHTVAPLPGVYTMGPIDQSVARAPLPIIGERVLEPVRVDPAEFEQEPFDVAQQWAFRKDVIRA
jgi:hypothetical protein